MAHRAILLALAVAAAQERPLIENSGKPMRAPFACGEEQIRALGLTCPPAHPCAVYLQLDGLATVGQRIFAAGNFHTDAATVESILLASDDAGKTWYEPHERIRSAALDEVRFIDLEHGWASGHILGAFPREPFFLVTRDGGKTWRARQVTVEARIGTIEAFEFESRTRGLVWVDRGHAAEEGNRWEVYETATGGDTWSLREMSDKPPGKKRAPPPAGWRLRADARSGAYRIETQTEGRWQPAASFLVRAGECKEPEVELVEPPPPAPIPQPTP
jgi:hypothetical protein